MLTCKHSKFTLPPAITYLNCAYMAPMLSSVEKAGIRGLRLKRNPARITPDLFFITRDLLRKEFAKLIHVTDSNRIAIIPSVSYGMATVAKNIRLKQGQKIIVAAEQFPSNYYVWKKLCDEAGAEVKLVAPPEDLSRRGQDWNAEILKAITPETKAVALGHVHWADGTRFDLEAIRKRTRETGALLIIDGTQSVGALSFDVQKIQPDVLVCAGYKWLLGPYSIGLAYYNESFDNGNPLEENWINRLHSEAFNRLVHYEQAYQPGALRYDVGEHSNFILLPMMLKAVQQLNRWGVENIQTYCKAITADAIQQLKERGFWVEEEAYRGSHLFGIRPPRHLDIDRLKNNLLQHKIYVSFRGNSIRVSPNVYNTATDLQRLVKALSL